MPPRPRPTRTVCRWMAVLSVALSVACVTSRKPPEQTLDQVQPEPEPVDACAAPMPDACQQTYSGCLDDEACQQTFSCAQKCTDNDKRCVWDCILARPDTVAAFMPASYCSTSSGGECSLPAGVIDECPTCSARSCPEQMKACFRNPECWELVACVRDGCAGPDDLECAQDCIGEHPDGLEQIEGLRDCATVHCVDDCAPPEGATPDPRFVPSPSSDDGDQGEGEDASSPDEPAAAPAAETTPRS